MSKAEERAFERYSIKRGDDTQETSGIDMQRVSDFIDGYHQAEEDLEPTLEDMEIIINAFLDLCIENKEQGKTKRYTDKEWCQEVLKRFKDLKK